MEQHQTQKLSLMKKVAKSAFYLDEIKSFKQQIIDLKLGKTSPGELLIVEQNPSIWNIENVDFKDKFVVIKQSCINKILEDHEIDFDLLSDVSSEIEKRVLSFESISFPNSRVVILDSKDNHNKDILVALHLNISKNNIEVSELSSMYGKKHLGFLLENTIKLEKDIEVTHKTDKWLQSNRIPFSALVTTYLQEQYNKKYHQTQGYSSPETYQPKGLKINQQAKAQVGVSKDER